GACRYNGGMALHWKLVVDSRNAPAIADFWAAALGYEVEDPGTLIDQLLAGGQLPEAAVIEHRDRKNFRGFAAIRHPDDPFDEVSGIGRGRSRLVQELVAGEEGRRGVLKRRATLRARWEHKNDNGPHCFWLVVQAPAGMEWCAARGLAPASRCKSEACARGAA